jgi:hypothetical protein
MFAASVGVVLNSVLPVEKMQQWEWREPLLLGCIIVPFLFRLRQSLTETDEFVARKHHPSTSELARRAGRHFYGHYDHRFVLYDYRLHADLWKFRAASGQHGQSHRHTLRRRLQSFLAARHGRTFRPNRPPSLFIRCTILMLMTAYPAMLWLVREPSFARR